MSAAKHRSVFPSDVAAPSVAPEGAGRGRSVVPPEGAEFITVTQAAHMVQVCTRTVREWVRAGRLRRYGERRLYRVRREEVLAVLAPASAHAREDEDAAFARSVLRRAGAQ